MITDHPKYQEDYCQIYLLLGEHCVPEISRYIMVLRQLVIEKEIKSIITFPTLIRFYLNFTTTDSIELYVEDKKIRRTIHEFCERNRLLSRSQYSPDIVLKRLCICGKWSNQHVENRGRAVFYCQQCEEIFGCSSSDGLEDLIEDKEVKCTYACNGSMLIMRRNNILPNYKKSGYTTYRKRRGFRNKK